MTFLILVGLGELCYHHTPAQVNFFRPYNKTQFFGLSATPIWGREIKYLPFEPCHRQGSATRISAQRLENLGLMHLLFFVSRVVAPKQTFCFERSKDPSGPRPHRICRDIVASLARRGGRADSFAPEVRREGGDWGKIYRGRLILC